jgi:hypothetical protein
VQSNFIFCGSHGHEILGQQSGAKWKTLRIRWVLLVEEFDYTMEDKPGRMHLQADHLSRLSEDIGISPVVDRLINNKKFVVTAQPK